MTQAKEQIRRHFRALRRRRAVGVHPGEAAAVARHWADLCAELDLRPGAGRFAFYCPVGGEVDVSVVMESHVPCLLPMLIDEAGAPFGQPMWGVYGGALSAFPLWQPLGHFPAQPRFHVEQEQWLSVSAVLLPALAVDASGTRLGQGGGWYDRCLAQLPPTVPLIAAVHDDAVLPAGHLPREEHDIPVHALVTPSGYQVVSVP